MKTEEFVKEAIEQFCLEFVKKPYLCYTEHGLHARFYLTLYNLLPGDRRYINFHNEDVCVVQKEYPTAHHLNKSRRQNWDIAVLEEPVSEQKSKEKAYDFLPLNSVIEFGLNEGQEHLVEDRRRLCHEKSNVKHKFIVHLYRISHSGNPFSGRDLSEKSKRILSVQEIFDLVFVGNCENLMTYVGVHDKTASYQNGVWVLSKSGIKQIFSDSSQGTTVVSS